MKRNILAIGALLLPFAALAQGAPRIWWVKPDPANNACALLAQRDALGSDNVYDIFYWQVRNLAELKTGFAFSRQEAEQLGLPPPGSKMAIDITVFDRAGGHILRAQQFEMSLSGATRTVTGTLPIDTLALLEKGSRLQVTYNGAKIYDIDLGGSAEVVHEMGPCMARITRALEKGAAE